MPFFSVGNHSGNGYFAACASCCGDGNERRQLSQHAQKPFHLVDRTVRVGNARAHRFGAIHGGTPAKCNQAAALFLFIKRTRLFHIFYRWVGACAIIHRAANVVFRQAGLQARCDARGAKALVGDKQSRTNAQPAQQGGNFIEVCKALRLPVRQNRQRQMEAELINTAKCPIQHIHKRGSPSLLSARRFSEICSNTS